MKQITKVERDQLLHATSSISEVCELFATSGQMVEVLETDNGYVVSVGKIDGDYKSEDMHNVTFIGDSYRFRDDARFYHAPTVAEALEFAIARFRTLVNVS